MIDYMMKNIKINKNINKIKKCIQKDNSQKIMLIDKLEEIIIIVNRK